MRWLQDITLGNYLPIDSIVHNLDPRFKIASMSVLMGATFLLSSLLSVALHTMAVLAVVRLSKIPLKYFLRSLRFFFWLFLFTAVLHLFFTSGTPITDDPLFGFITITYEGIHRGGVVSWRLLVVVGLSALLTHTTTPLEITRGMETILSPLEKLRFPVQDFALMMMIAIRFIPVLFDETQKVWKAQKARGADFSRGGPKRRANTLLSVLLPVFTGIFRRADDLAIALESRGYVPGRKRTSMKVLIWTARETLASVAVLIWIIAVGVGQVLLGS